MLSSTPVRPAGSGASVDRGAVRASATTLASPVIGSGRASPSAPAYDVVPGHLRGWSAVVLFACLAGAASFVSLAARPLLPPVQVVLLVAFNVVVAGFLARSIFGRIERMKAQTVRQSSEQRRLEADHQVLLEQTRRRAEEAAALYELSRHVALSPNSSHVLEAVARQAIDLLGASTVRICLLDRDNRVPRHGGSARPCALPCGARATDDFRTDKATKSRQAPGAVDLSRRGFCPLIEPRFTRTHLAVPLLHEGELVGALCAGSEHDGKWGAASTAPLESLASFTAIAVQKEYMQGRVDTLAIVEEHERISKGLHDEIIRRIDQVRLNLEEVTDQAPADPSGASARIERAIGDLNGIIQDVRRYIFDLEPSEADAELGLACLAREL